MANKIDEDVNKVAELSVDINRIGKELLSLQSKINGIYGSFSPGGRPPQGAAEKAKEVAAHVSKLTKELMRKRAELKKIQDENLSLINDKLTDEQKEMLKKAKRNIDGYSVKEKGQGR